MLFWLLVGVVIVVVALVALFVWRGGAGVE
jgi:hypothetical protein